VRQFPVGRFLSRTRGSASRKIGTLNELGVTIAWEIIVEQPMSIEAQ
jgi:hypothetical protein